jgi:hypothetical protein
MAVPVIETITPALGLTTGDELVRIATRDVADHVAVLFGPRRAQVIAIHTEDSRSLIDVRSPTGPPGGVDVVIDNLDAGGAPIPGERALITNGYRYARPDLREEADLTRLVRALLRSLKDQILEEVHLSVAVDYAEPGADGLQVTALASLPSLVLSGPLLRANAFYTAQVSTVEPAPALGADQVVLRRPSSAFDLSFQLTGASDRTVELVNLMAAVASFLDRNRWLELERDPTRPELGYERFELDQDGDTRMRVAGSDGVHVFTSGLVVRGVALVEGPITDVTRPVTSLLLNAAPTAPRSSSRG